MRKESTTTFLRRGFISTLALCIALLTSCSGDSVFGDDEKTSASSNGNCESGLGKVGVTASADSKDYDEMSTRSSLDFNASKGMIFKWDNTDKLTVFAQDNYASKQIYSIDPRDAYSSNADFSTQDFKLTVDKRYFALSKDEGNYSGGSETKVPDQKNITIDYSGQVQDGNANPSHLGKYDFMAASSVCEAEDQLHFSFKHLGATLRIKIKCKDGDTKYSNVKFYRLELYSADNSFRQPIRRFDLTKGVQSDGSFLPTLEAPDYAGDVKRFAVDLKNGGNNYITPNSTYIDGTTESSNVGYNLIAYIEVPPADLRTTSLGLVAYGKDEGGNDVTYFGTRNGFNIEAGKAYQPNFEISQTTDYTVTLKVDHLWKYGNTVEVTRAGTGDPGYDKEFVQPNHLYYIFCVGGKVKAVKGLTGETQNACNSIVVDGVGSNKWTFDKESKISTYGQMLTFPTTNEDKDKKKQLFVIGANRPLSETAFSGLQNDDPISKVLALTYNITTSDPQTTTQVFLRDLYSTPYDTDANFVGNLNDPMQDVFLYHTAAKVDLKWNNTTGKALAGNVSVNNVYSENLSLFKPTVNTSATNANYTVSTAITPGTCWNGRQVYYLPQFNTYNVTLGNDINFTDGKRYTGTQNMTFTPITTGGFTSWLRGLATLVKTAP